MNAVTIERGRIKVHGARIGRLIRRSKKFFVLQDETTVLYPVASEDDAVRFVASLTAVGCYAAEMQAIGRAWNGAAVEGHAP